MGTLAQRRAEYDIARKQFADSTVSAPYDGAIQTRPASPGEYVATGTPIATLVKTDPLRLRLDVSERDSPLVRLGQAVRLQTEGSTNVFCGRIARLSPALSSQSRMLRVEADVPNPGALRPGLFARAQIVVDEHDTGLSIPPNALSVFAGIEKVVTLQEGKVKEINVTIGRRGPDWIEVVSGVTAGMPVVLQPEGLRSGQAVTVTNAAPENADRTPRVNSGS
jgi:RND family efflux transporter MFP subunit